MADIVLFHHVLGLTAGVVSFADELRRHGHVVHTPDLFEGRTFPDIDAGAAFVGEIGFGTIVERGAAAVESLPAALVYAGFSLGAVPAQSLAQQRPGALGALLLEACVPVTEFGDRWPDDVPVQIHGMSDDPFFAGEGDIDAARALVAQAASSTSAELFTYAGDHHLFTDDSLESHDPTATALVIERVLAFLDRIDRDESDEPTTGSPP
jgi:dienelactone hydrolase